MPKIAWKAIKGNGPYAYLQQSIKHKSGKVTSKHLAYLGKIGSKATPGKRYYHMGQGILAPPVPKDVKKTLKPAALANLEKLVGPTKPTVAPKPPQIPPGTPSSKPTALAVPIDPKSLDILTAAVKKELAAKKKTSPTKADVQEAFESIKKKYAAKKAGKATSIIEEGDDSKLQETVKKVGQGKLKTPSQSKVSESQRKAAMMAKRKDYDADLVKQGGALGSNEGAMFKDKRLQTISYVKWPGELRARMEVLAGQLYRHAGVPVPETRLIKHNKQLAVQSDWIKDLKTLTPAQMKKDKTVRENFPVDAWLANWDVVGLQADNIAAGPNKYTYRIDAGGSLIYRAKGKPKPSFDASVPELETMRSSSTAPQASKVFEDLKVPELKAGAKKVAGVSDTQIDLAVDQAGIPKKGAKVPGYPANLNLFMKKALKARRDAVVKKIADLKVPKQASLSELTKTSGLPESYVTKIRDNANVIKPGGSHSKRETLHREGVQAVIKDPKEAEKAYTTVENYFKRWKSTTVGRRGNMLRWAAAKAASENAGKRSVPAMKRFWQYLRKKGMITKTQADNFQAELETDMKKDGKNLVAGVKANSKIHQALIRSQFVTNFRPGRKIYVYRGWKEDQLNFFGWKGAKVGDKLKFKDPVIYSFSFSPNTAKNFSHGDSFTRAEIPTKAVLLTDRLTGANAPHQGEDEILWVMPAGTELEVIKKA